MLEHLHTLITLHLTSLLPSQGWLKTGLQRRQLGFAASDPCIAGLYVMHQHHPGFICDSHVSVCISHFAYRNMVKSMATDHIPRCC